MLILYGAGFVRFLGPYYMLVIKRRKKVGEICGHAVYGIAETEQIMIPYPSPETRVANSLAERRYLIDHSCNGFVYSYERKKKLYCVNLINRTHLLVSIGTRIYSKWWMLEKTSTSATHITSCIRSRRTYATVRVERFMTKPCSCGTNI